MEMYATTVFVIADEVLRILNLKDDNQSRMSNAEIITFAICTAKFFSGNFIPIVIQNLIPCFVSLPLNLIPLASSNSFELNCFSVDCVWLKFRSLPRLKLKF